MDNMFSLSSVCKSEFQPKWDNSYGSSAVLWCPDHPDGCHRRLCILQEKEGAKWRNMECLISKPRIH